MFEDEFCIFICQGKSICADQRNQYERDQVRVQINQMYSPKQPCKKEQTIKLIKS